MNQHEKINYIEFPARNMEETKQFFSAVFGWKFEDFGTEYTAFYRSESGLDGGFYRSESHASAENGSALLVFFSANLEETLAKIEHHNGTIIRPIFEFPGGRRFHFTDPSGNEFAVWGDLEDREGR